MRARELEQLKPQVYARDVILDGPPLDRWWWAGLYRLEADGTRTLVSWCSHRHPTSRRAWYCASIKLPPGRSSWAP